MPKEDPKFSDRGYPAFMSPNEPAISLLRERYSESFALTKSKENQVHLFLIRVGLWSLVWTFTPRDVDCKQIQLSDALALIEVSLKTGSHLITKLDKAVEKARGRIENKVNEFTNRLPLC